MFAVNSRFRAPYGIFALGVALSVMLWVLTNRMQPLWPNVPPAPSLKTAPYLGLGDTEYAYRTLAYQLQVIGNTSGKSTPLYMYDYDRLGDWFQVLHRLDAQSDYVPYLAAYYFGATQDPRRQLGPVIDYLDVAGSDPYPGKWRWLAQATFMAYHERGDTERGMALAYKLSDLKDQPDMPHWARQMPAIVAAAKGDKGTALTLMRSILVATLDNPYHKPDPVEVNFMVDFICTRMQTPSEAARDALCRIPGLK